MKKDWALIAEQEKNAILKKMKTLQAKDHLDEDGYPTDAALRLIEIWHFEDQRGWFDFIKSIWHLSSWGWHEKEETHDFYDDQTVIRLYVSTAGWSGNESIIFAMEKNHMLWHFSWVQSRRGGHYIFEISQED